jgi:CheY-like chemotaxis protein
MTAKKRILLVDDNEDIRTVFQEGLEGRGFDVVPASNVNQALTRIATEKFDVLLSDLHMPDAGDGFTVVSAMRHAHPKAVTLVLSGYPALQEAMSAILLEADEVLVKPIGLSEITEIIQRKLAEPSVRKERRIVRVAVLLERDLQITIKNWLAAVEQNAELAAIPLNYEERTGHLPLLLEDLARRLLLPANATPPISAASRSHGILRREQGYSVAMMVEESRILQVSIFKTLQDNFKSVEFSTVLLDVMTIADEVDSQLKQAVLGFMEAHSAKKQTVPARAMANH